MVDLWMDPSSRTVRAFSPGRWTFGGDVRFGTVISFDSDCNPGRRPMEGIPVLEPLEHLVLEMALVSGLMEGISDLEPLEHSVLNAALDGRPMEATPVLEPLEQSVLEVALDGGPVDEKSHLEPLEHSVLKAALDGRPMERIPVLEPLEHSVLDMVLDRGLMKGDGGPKLGPDRKLTFLEIPHVTRDDDLVLGAAVPLPAESVGQVTLSPAEVRLSTGDVNTDGNITAGFESWNTEGVF